jgi:membrane protease YdiL (CAAX protease family)
MKQAYPFIEGGRKSALKHFALFLFALGIFVVLQSLLPFIWVSGTDPATIIQGLFDRFPAGLALCILLLPFLAVLAMIFGATQWLGSGVPHHVVRRSKRIRWDFFFQFSLVCFALQTLLTGLDLLWFPDAYQWMSFPSDWVAFALVGFVGYALQALSEEVLFRTLPMRFCFGLWPQGWFAVLASALLFGLMHMGNQEVDALGGWEMFFIYSLNGGFLAWLTLRSNGLELAWAFHWVNNWMGSAVVTFPASTIPGPALWMRDTPDPKEMLVFSVLQVALFAFVAWFLFLRKKGAVHTM